MNMMTLGSSAKPCGTWRRSMYPARQTAEKEEGGIRNCQQVCRGRKNALSRALTLRNLSDQWSTRNIRELLLTKPNLIWVTKWCNAVIWGWCGTTDCTKHLVFTVILDFKRPSPWIFYFTIQVPLPWQNLSYLSHHLRNKLPHLVQRDKRPLKHSVQHITGGEGRWMRIIVQHSAFRLWEQEPDDTYGITFFSPL